MRCVSLSDLERRPIDVQRASASEPVVVEQDGEPCAVIMSAREFARLKAKANEAWLPASWPSPTMPSAPRAPDPLGYDTRDFWGCARAMAADALAGRTADAVAAEIVAVEQRLRRGL